MHENNGNIGAVIINTINEFKNQLRRGYLSIDVEIYAYFSYCRQRHENGNKEHDLYDHDDLQLSIKFFRLNLY